MDDSRDLSKIAFNTRDAHDDIEELLLHSLHKLGPSSLDRLAMVVRRAYPTGFKNVDNALPLALTGNALSNLSRKRLVKYVVNANDPSWVSSRHTRLGWERKRNIARFAITFEGWVKVMELRR